MKTGKLIIARGKYSKTWVNPPPFLHKDTIKIEELFFLPNQIVQSKDQNVNKAVERV